MEQGTDVRGQQIFRQFVIQGDQLAECRLQLHVAMSGMKGRRISADMFAIMLKISAGPLFFAARHDKQ